MTLSPEAVAHLAALKRALAWGHGFALHVVTIAGARAALREVVETALRELADAGDVVVLPAGPRARAAVLDWLDKPVDPPARAVLIPDSDALLAGDGEGARRLNLARDRLPAQVSGPLVILCAPDQLARWVDLAPDLMDARSGTWRFAAAPEVRPTLPRFPAPAPAAIRQQRRNLQARVRRLRAAERQGRLPPGDLAWAWFQLARSFSAAGDVDAAEEHASRALQLAMAAGMSTAVADIHHLLASLAVGRGDLQAAETHWRDQALPAAHAIGDERLEAAVRSGLALVIAELGRPAEAAAELRDRVIPVLQRLGGDPWAAAAAWSNLGTILEDLGDVDGAVRALREQALPAFEHLQTWHDVAAVTGKLADLEVRRGHHDEALRLLTDQALPAADKAGDAALRDRILWRIMFLLGGVGSQPA